ncbi:NDP-hexose 2,3-dehydratase family protein [Enhygromyxa salina]|uniref:NDP-hexose 2,3-dehydratase n=1 Tax=Enhygromyxa salina TaxID=215803 RepID=A0A2S9Y5X3_9BACT|nr:NDP-hexose 2,3-dehydratase family protein [Enhygromyxa salina]PRQ00494.1 NDP-hexose 2,3-dehydratase [Enhygromyxa salina]
MSTLRSSAQLCAALRRSLEAESGPALSQWLGHARARCQAHVEPIELAGLERWSLDPSRLALAHDSGQFFSVIGAKVELGWGSAASRRVTQPLIAQDEVGILGLLMRIADGRAEFLVQAKFEPGDPQPVQLGPTLQATRSNYSRAHGGRLPAGVSEFLAPRSSAVVVDVELPEQAEFFLAKRNRNMVVLVDHEVELSSDERFRWATLAELRETLAQPNAVNMSLRSVLACALAVAIEPPSAATTSTAATTLAGLSWSWDLDRAPLDELIGWTWSARGLVADGASADLRAGLVFVEVTASEREVPRWTQPMLTRAAVVPIDLYVHTRAGQWWLLARISLDAGQREGPRLGPSAGPASSPIASARATLRFDTELAEDGGRLLALRHRYRVWELVDPPSPAVEPGCVWIPLAEVPELLRRGLIDVELRTCLLALMMLHDCPRVPVLGGDQRPASSVTNVTASTASSRKHPG